MKVDLEKSVAKFLGIETMTDDEKVYFLQKFFNMAGLSCVFVDKEKKAFRLSQVLRLQRILIKEYQSIYLELKKATEKNKWVSFGEKLPREKTHILIKRVWSDEEIAEWDNFEPYEKIDYMTGILEKNVLRAGDRGGSINKDVRNDEIQNKYFWRYIENDWKEDKNEKGSFRAYL